MLFGTCSCKMCIGHSACYLIKLSIPKAKKKASFFSNLSLASWLVIITDLDQFLSVMEQTTFHQKA